MSLKFWFVECEIQGRTLYTEVPAKRYTEAIRKVSNDLFSIIDNKYKAESDKLGTFLVQKSPQDSTSMFIKFAGATNAMIKVIKAHQKNSPTGRKISSVSTKKFKVGNMNFFSIS